jgi:hypothetical protein
MKNSDYFKKKIPNESKIKSERTSQNLIKNLVFAYFEQSFLIPFYRIPSQFLSKHDTIIIQICNYYHLKSKIFLFILKHFFRNKRCGVMV